MSRKEALELLSTDAELSAQVRAAIAKALEVEEEDQWEESSRHWSDDDWYASGETDE